MLMLTFVYLLRSRAAAPACLVLALTSTAVAGAPIKSAAIPGAQAHRGLGDNPLKRTGTKANSALRATQAGAPAPLGLGDYSRARYFNSTILRTTHPLAAFEGMSTGKALLALGAVLFIITILNINARRKRLGQTPKRKDAERLDRKAEALRRELEALVVELSEFSRQANGQIDTRFAKLEHSIRDADERIAELTALLEAAGIAVPQRKRPTQLSGNATTENADDLTPSPAQGKGRGKGFNISVGDAPARGQRPPQNGGLSTTHPTGSGDEGAVPIEAEHSEDADIDDSIMAANQEAAAGVRGGRKAQRVADSAQQQELTSSLNRDEQICALIDNGLAPADVAERLNCSIGEVELVLNLRGRG